jgi:uncharacterized membrane protein YdcZ (DUF606 family)
MLHDPGIKTDLTISSRNAWTWFWVVGVLGGLYILSRRKRD